MQAEIPPEVLDAILADVAEFTKNRGLTPSWVEMAELAAPRLFALWAERLTSDEAVEAFRGATIKGRYEAHNELRCRLAAVAAALSPVSGKDEADAT